MSTPSTVPSQLPKSQPRAEASPTDGAVPSSSPKLQKWILGSVLLVLAVVGGVAGYRSQKAHRASLGRDALHAAEKLFAEEMKLWVKSELESTKTAAPPKKPAKGSEKTPPENPAQKEAETEARLQYLKIEPRDRFPKSMNAFDAVAKDYANLTPGRDASMKLGGLYFRHGHAVEAVEHFQRAYQGSALALEKSLSGVALATAQLEVGSNDALEQALKLTENLKSPKDSPVVGPALLLKGRILQRLGRQDEAKKAYEELVARMPQTAFSREAEALMAKISEKP